MWAFPHQYEADDPDGTSVRIELGVGGTWHLIRSEAAWTLERNAMSTSAAVIELPEPVGWRQLTGLPVPEGSIHLAGDLRLLRPLLKVRGIIA